jgi:hypothetical protein
MLLDTILSIVEIWSLRFLHDGRRRRSDFACGGGMGLQGWMVLVETFDFLMRE